MKRFLVIAVFVLAPGTAAAVDLVIDYSYDTSNFFGSGNPDGSAAGATARASLEAAADFLSVILTDSFSAIETPPDYASSVFDGVVSWEWNLSFPNPATGSLVTLYDQTIAEDEYVIYAGGRSIAGTTIGVGGPGGWGWSSGGNGGFFTSAEVNEINAISADFGDAVTNRGGPSSEFSNWGGAIAFDTDNGANWHWDHTTSPESGKNDFYSTAIHELVHAVGFGTSTEFDTLRSGTLFTGTASVSEYGGFAPLDSDYGHWADGVSSRVFGGTAVQEAAMDPDILIGTRKHLTALDAAALSDIGWEVVEPIPPTLAGDYNDDGVVDAADYTVWRTTFEAGAPTGSLAEWRNNYGASAAAAGTGVPEPATMALMLAALAPLSRRGRPALSRPQRGP